MRELLKLRFPPRRVEWSNSSMVKELPDAILVRETKSGNDLAYGELIHRYQDRLFTVVPGLMQNREDALALTQEVFIEAYAGLGRFRVDAGFYTWVYTTAVNAVIASMSRRRRS